MRFSSSHPHGVLHGRLLWAVIGAWAVAVIASLGVLLAYSQTPGSPARPPDTWPTDVELATSEGAATLVLFAHPRCPCTRATLSEFARIMNQSHDSVRAHVVFLRPSGFEEGWERTDLWDTASNVPNVETHADPGGRLTHRFGAETSGQVLLYDRAEQLAFEGGITSARGHEGDNVGKTMVLQLLSGLRTARASAPVYGCSLTGPIATNHSEDSTSHGCCQHK